MCDKFQNHPTMRTYHYIVTNPEELARWKSIWDDISQESLESGIEVAPQAKISKLSSCIKRYYIDKILTNITGPYGNMFVDILTWGFSRIDFYAIVDQLIQDNFILPSRNNKINENL
jgi:hypothetical protein